MGWLGSRPSRTQHKQLPSHRSNDLHGQTPAVCEGPSTQAIFVAATRCNFCRAKVATSFKHLRNPCDIAATDRIKNCTWFTRAILKLQLWRYKNCVELPRQKLPVQTGLAKKTFFFTYFVSLSQRKNYSYRSVITYGQLFFVITC